MAAFAAAHGVRNQVKPRTCLACGEEFKSEGPGNRICPDCRPLEDRTGILFLRALRELPLDQWKYETTT